MAHDVMQDIMFGPDGNYWVYEDGVYSRDPLIIQRRVNDILKNKAAARYTNSVIHIIDPLLNTLTHDKPDPTYINLYNGMYNHVKQNLEPHSPSFNSVVQLPITYDPDAQCPVFEAFLEKVCPKEALPMVWEVVAYLLMPGNPLQKAILFYGPGSNGKSNFINVMEALVGKKNCSNITLNQLSRVFEPAELLGKQLNTVGDLNMQFLKDTETFKQITGGDPITAQRKNKDPFTFVNWAVPVFAANNLWKSNDLSLGYFRRWQIISFPNKVTEKDFKYSREELITEKELSGIFNKAMTYLAPLLKRKRFQTTLHNDLIMAQFQHESDNVAIWALDDDTLLDICHPDNDKIYCRKSFSYKRYKHWCYESGHRPLSNQAFYKRLESSGYRFARRENQTVVLGLDFKDKDFIPNV